MGKAPITIVELDNDKTIKDYFIVFLGNPEFGKIISRYARAILSNDAERANNYLENELWRFLSDGTKDFCDSELDQVFWGLVAFIKLGSMDRVKALVKEGVRLSERPDREPLLDDRVLIPKLCASIKVRLTEELGKSFVDPRYRNIQV